MDAEDNLNSSNSSIILENEQDVIHKESTQYDTDDSCDEIFTQAEESETKNEQLDEYLKNEQKILEKQMELFSDSLKMRYEIASKKFKKWGFYSFF